MKITPAIKKRLLSFNWRYIEHVSGNVYQVFDAKNMFPKPSKPHVLDEQDMCFWHDNCEDHPERIELRNILLFN